MLFRSSNITGDSGLNSFGQFSGAGSLLADGVAGSFTGTFPSTSALAATLSSLIGSAFASYSDVSLDLLSSSGPCTIGLPSDITGSFTRATTNTFDFGSVSITGTASGTCSFSIGLEADGALLATESDTVTVTGTKTAVPEPGSILLLGVGLLGLGGLVRRRK